MAEFIIHLNGAYNIFGTIADGAHYESALTLDQLREVIREQRGELGLSDLPARLKRAHADGCSAFHMDLEDCISSNRQGPNESRLSRDEFIKRFLTLSTPVPKREDAAAQSEAAPATLTDAQIDAGCEAWNYAILKGMGEIAARDAFRCEAAGVPDTKGGKHG